MLKIKNYKVYPSRIGGYDIKYKTTKYKIDEKTKNIIGTYKKEELIGYATGMDGVLNIILDDMRKKTGELELFIEIWKERKEKDGRHRSFISGKYLDSYVNTDWFLDCFPHVIPKNGIGRLPAFPNKYVKDKLLRLNKDNIVLATPQEHFLIDQGTKQQREEYEKANGCSFDKFYEKQNRLIEIISHQLKTGDY